MKTLSKKMKKIHETNCTLKRERERKREKTSDSFASDDEF